MREALEIPGTSLLSGERVIWQGKPTDGLIFRPVELLLVPFSIFWAGFALFWNVSVWTSSAPISFKLFGLPFLVIAIYVVVGRFIVDSWVRKRTRYTVTNKRVLIGRDGRNSVRSLDITRLPTLELHEKADGSGTIWFDRASSWMAAGGFGIWQPSLDSNPQFVGIENVSSVYQLIQKQTVS